MHLTYITISCYFLFANFAIHLRSNKRVPSISVSLVIEKSMSVEGTRLIEAIQKKRREGTKDAGKEEENNTSGFLSFSLQHSTT